MAAELVVFIKGARAGTARALAPERGRLPVLFRYDDAYAAGLDRTPLSVSVPVDAGDSEIGDWLDGLLPDDPGVREDWADREDADGSDAVSLLSTPIGLDCAGAVQFCAPGNESAVTTRRSGVDWRTETEIADWIRDAKAGGRWNHLGEHGWYSLGGYQTKIALYHDGDRWGVPFGQLPTTHILKPGIAPTPRRRYDDSDLIEHVTMAAAAEIGLNAATTRIERFEAERVLVVERYDRFSDEAGLRRLHQEDLCQALKRSPTEKYQSLGGPTPAEIADLIRHESVAVSADLDRFLDALIFNWAVAATDAHAKNYSLILEGDTVALAPLYDIMSHLPYRHDQPVSKIKTAMKTGRDYRLSAADHANAWERTARQLDLDPAQAVARAETVLGRCPEAIDAAIDALDPDDRASPKVALLSREVHQRRADVLDTLWRSQWREPARRVPSMPVGG